MARGVWGVDIRSLDTGERLYELDAGTADDAGVEHEDRDARRGGGDPRLGLPVHHDARDDRRRSKAACSRATSSSAAAAIRRSTRARGARRRRLAEWAAALRAAGIQQIDGRVIGDDQRFDDEGIGAGLGVGLPAVRLRRAGRRAAVQREPGDADGHALASRPARRRRRRSDAGCRPAPDQPRQHGRAGRRRPIDYRRRLDEPVLEVSGTIAAGIARRSSATVAVVNPTIFFAQSLKDGLIARGIPITGRGRRPRRRRRRAAGARPPNGASWRNEIAAAARDRHRADEGQPEPLRRDAGQGDRRVARRAGHVRGRPDGVRRQPAVLGRARPTRTSSPTDPACRATTT